MIRRAVIDDVGDGAYLMLKWDSELPEHIKALEGNAKHAESIATLVITNPRFHTFVVERDDRLIAAYSLSITGDLFTPHPVAIMCMWYVLPEYRHEMIGVRLLLDAIKYAKSLNVSRMDVAPWADSMNADRLLTRKSFGFMHTANLYSRFF
jgi:L-amino acid N-acyltransferase YncA